MYRTKKWRLWAQSGENELTEKYVHFMQVMLAQKTWWDFGPVPGAGFR